MKTKILFIAFSFIATITFSQKKWTLKECVNHALENNISIQQAKLNLKVSQTDVKNAKGNFLPAVNASTNGNLSFGSNFDPVSQNRVSTTIFGGSLGVNANTIIFNGFRNTNTYKQAKLGVESSNIDLQVMQNDVALQVVNSYLNVLFVKENLSVLKTQYEVSQKQVERVKTQFEEGAIAKTQLLNIQSTVANDYQNVVNLENNLNLALLNLAQLLQIDATNFDVVSVNVTDFSPAMLYNSGEEVFEKAVQERPEIKRQNLNIESADLAIEIAKSNYLPTLSASASVGSNYGFNLDPQAGLDFLTQLDNNLGYGAGLRLTIPIFNGFKNDATVERAKINRDISETRLQNQKLVLKQTIQKAYLDAKLAANTYESANKSLAAQKEAYKNAEASYKYGTMTVFDFDQVRSRLVNAESVLIRAKYDYIFKSKVLQFYYGENILD